MRVRLRGKRVLPGIESRERDRINQDLWQLVFVVLCLRPPRRGEVLRKQAGELPLPGQQFLLTRVNKSFPELVHAPNVIVVSVGSDRDHPLSVVYEPAE